jgi:hypothetical protein
MFGTIIHDVGLPVIHEHRWKCRVLVDIDVDVACAASLSHRKSRRGQRCPFWLSDDTAKDCPATPVFCLVHG